MKRIICIGNRYIFEDSAGPKVYERLLRHSLPDDVELIDGGLGGMNLLPFMEGVERVLFVDSVTGFRQPNPGEGNSDGGIVILEAREIAALSGNIYDHSAGLAYLLRVLPEVCEGPAPYIQLAGIEGRLDEELIDKAAALVLKIIKGGS